jgi:hypothetical protein
MSKTVFFVVREGFFSDSFKHYNIQRHQRTQHGATVEKPAEYFKRMIAKAKKNHTISKTLIKPVVLQTVSTMLDENAARKVIQSQFQFYL